MSQRWLMNTSFVFNSTIVNNSYAGAFANTVQEDPTNLAARNGFQYDYLTAGSGLGNVYVNAKWLFKLSGLYQIPGEVNLSAFYNARQGYPFEASIQSPSRANGAASRPFSSTTSVRIACPTTRTWTSTSSVRSNSARCGSSRQWTCST
jgi:hypothetical protein